MTKQNKGIDQTLVRELANILNETDLTEIEVEQDALRIRVSRSSSQTQIVAAPAAPAAIAAAPAPTASSAPAAADSADTSAPAVSGEKVPSPMVGTAYLAPSPDSDPFVTVGQTVKEGQTLLIIEAMKTMNQIPSPKSGKIVEISVTDSQPVEYGDTLVVIE